VDRSDGDLHISFGAPKFRRVTDTEVNGMSSNWILRALPEDERASVLASCTPVMLPQHRAIYRPGDLLDHVYFLESGLVSLLSVARDGRAIETGIVGREGLIGGHVILGRPVATGEAVVQISGQAMKVPTARLLRLLESSPTLATLVNRHIDLLLLQAQQNALCHALHSIESRFCRWLLQASDTLESDLLHLTQEFCSHVLGVQRTSLSMVAHALQTAGGIRTRRGKIELLDRRELEKTACECYERAKQHLAATELKAA
jgi:CRP-like cAMP-binding protein